MRWLSVLLGVIFSVAGFKAIFAFDPTTSVLSRPILLLISVAGAALFFALFARASSNTKQLTEFEHWLMENSRDVLASGANYNGNLISAKTEMTQFLMTISIVFLTLKFPSRYYVAGRDNVNFAQMSCTLTTLLLGWWGIPWGPIYTVQTLAKNISGGYKTTVGEYLNERQNS